MDPSTRCDRILELIDAVLADAAATDAYDLGDRADVVADITPTAQASTAA